MELFQTVSHPSQATSLCNMPGHHLWAWAGRQAGEAGTTLWEAMDKKRSHLSEKLLMPKQKSEPQSRQRVLNSELPQQPLKLPGEKNGGSEVERQ